MSLLLDENEKKIARFNQQKANQAATDSGKKFLGMVNDNVVKPAVQGLNNYGDYAAQTLSYVNPVDIVQRIPEYSRQAQEGLANYDKAAAERYRENPGQVIGTQQGIIGPEYPETKASLAAKSNIPLKDLPGGKLPEGNLDALMGINQEAPVFNLHETGMNDPGYVSPEGVAKLRTEKETNINTPLQDIGEKIPEGHIATLDGWKPKQEVLPGNSFNEDNTKSYFEKTGYMSDDDPRMVKRRAEAQEVQAGRERFIENSRAGKYDLGNGPTIAGGRRRRPKGSGRMGTAERIATANQNSDERIATGRTIANIARYQNQNTEKPVTVSDKMKTRKERNDFINNYSLGDLDLPPQVGELVYDLGTRSGSSFEDVESAVHQELLNQLKNDSDVDFTANPEDLLSQLRSKLRDSGYDL